MLEHNSTADVLFFVHAGFEPFVNIGRILRNVPFTEPVRVHMWRVSRTDIPTEPHEQYRWLFGEFERMERWVEAQLNPSGISLHDSGSNNGLVDGSGDGSIGASVNETANRGSERVLHTGQPFPDEPTVTLGEQSPTIDITESESEIHSLTKAQ